jgi:hypothetical protein
MVLYEVNGNYIDTEPMKDSCNNLLVAAYQSLWARVTIKGTVKPQVHILDNEASAFFKTEITKNVTYNWFHWTCTIAIWPSKRFKHLRIISSPSLPVLTYPSQCIYGIN